MNLLDLYQRRGLTARRASSHKGGEYHGPCPAPGCGGEDRFHLWPQQGESGTFWCRQCGIGGDAIQFLRDIEGMGYREACAALGKEPAGLSPSSPSPPRLHPPQWQPEAATIPGEEWQAKAAALVEWAHGHLLANPEQLAWLAARGIGLETVKAARLGWSPGEHGKDLWRPRAAWGLPEEMREDTGKPRRLWIPRGLVIPRMEGAAVHRLRIRRPEGEPRYYVLPGSSAAPLYLGQDQPAAVVVEAELDALALFAAAGDLVGAYAIGNSSAKPDAASAARLRRLDLILVSTDFDDPDAKGERAGTKAARWWLERFPPAERWPVPAGKDPGDAYQAGVCLREWIIAGLPAGLSRRPETRPEAAAQAPGAGDIMEGKTGSGRRYLLVEDPEDLTEAQARHPGCAVFTLAEADALWQMTPAEAEAAISAREAGGGFDDNEPF